MVEKLSLPKTLLKSAALPKEMENEEERRLFFVAITRAKRQLFLLYPKTLDDKEKMPSMFVSELQTETHDCASVESIGYKKAEITNAIHVKPPEDGEYAFIMQFFENYKLSPTELNMFLDDPKKFLRNVVYKYPFEENDVMTFGTAYHKAIEEYHLDWIKNGVKPTLAFVEQAFTKSLSRSNISYDRFEDLLAQGKE